MSYSSDQVAAFYDAAQSGAVEAAQFRRSGLVSACFLE
jgi:hypothetical protein